MQPDEPSLIFARHGRTAWTLEGRYQGRSDTPLSAEGEGDAEALAESLRDAGLARIFASPLQRAMTTARIVGVRLGLEPVRVDHRLTEIGHGAWEGLTQAEVKRLWPAQLRQWKQAPETVRFPGGETLAEARSRLLGFLGDLALFDAPKRRAGPVLVVAHKGLIRLAVLEATGAPLADFRRIGVEPGSAHRFTLSPGGRLESLTGAVARTSA